MPSILQSQENANSAGISVSAGGGFGYQLSGIGAPSGDVSSSEYATSGPWKIIEQDVTVTYKRVPSAVTNLALDFDEYKDLTLTSYTSEYFDRNAIGGASGDVAETCLAVNVKASVKVTKSYDLYSASSYQQPQKFAVYALSADKRGLSCGTVGTDMLGPQGEIHTTQKFYSRRPWDSNNDSVMSKSVDCYNFSIHDQADAAASGLYWCTSGSEPLFYGGEKYWPHAFKAYLHHCKGIAYHTSYLSKPGSYTTALDNTSDVRILLDRIATDLNNRYRLWNSEPNPTFNGPADAGYLPEYDGSRHHY